MNLKRQVYNKTFSLGNYCIHFPSNFLKNHNDSPRSLNSQGFYAAAAKELSERASLPDVDAR